MRDSLESLLEHMVWMAKQSGVVESEGAGAGERGHDGAREGHRLSDRCVAVSQDARGRGECQYRSKNGQKRRSEFTQLRVAGDEPDI